MHLYIYMHLFPECVCSLHVDLLINYVLSPCVVMTIFLSIFLFLGIYLISIFLYLPFLPCFLPPFLSLLF